MLTNNTQTNRPLRFLQQSYLFVGLIFLALIAFESFNFTTTEHALKDLLGDITFLGFFWSTLLAIAFCGIDFAGIARLFTPEQGSDEPKEVWYLFGAWLLAATMNAVLTWWGVSMAISNRAMESAAVIDHETLVKVVPLFVAIMVWVIRILIIGSLSIAMDRMMHPGDTHNPALHSAIASVTRGRVNVPAPQPVSIPATLNSAAVSPRPAPRPAATNARAARSAGPVQDASASMSAEPTYHSLNSRPTPERSSNASRFQRS